MISVPLKSSNENVPLASNPFFSSAFETVNDNFKYLTKGFQPRSNTPYWKWSSGWLESWEGLFLATDLSTTCAEAKFKVAWLSKQKSPKNVLNELVYNSLVTVSSLWMAKINTATIVKTMGKEG